MLKTGICPRCKKGPRNLTSRDPESGSNICQVCYSKITGKISPMKIGICSECGKGPGKTIYRHPDPEKKRNICPNCYGKFKRLEKNLSAPVKSLPVKVAKPKVEKTEKRRIKYPDKESVIKALELRVREGKENCSSNIALEDMTLCKAAHKFGVALLNKRSQKCETTISRSESKPLRLARTPVIVPSSTPAPIIRKRKANAKKPGKKAKYPTREATIEALEFRETQGEENFPSVLGIEDVTLYQAVLRFDIELPRKKDPPIRYYLGDLARNQNPKDPYICGKIGKVVGVNERVILVKFNEPGRVIRIYGKWFNLNNITLDTRNPRSLAETPKESRALTEEFKACLFSCLPSHTVSFVSSHF